MKTIFKFVGNKVNLFLQQGFFFFLPSVFILFSQALIELVVACVYQILTNFSYGCILALS